MSRVLILLLLLLFNVLCGAFKKLQIFQESESINVLWVLMTLMLTFKVKSQLWIQFQSRLMLSLIKRRNNGFSNYLYTTLVIQLWWQLIAKTIKHLVELKLFIDQGLEEVAIIVIIVIDLVILQKEKCYALMQCHSGSLHFPHINYQRQFYATPPHAIDISVPLLGLSTDHYI